MLRILNFCWLFLLTNTLVSGQEGTITFNRKYHWVNIVSKMPYLSLEEKDRIKLSWGNDSENKGEDFILTFNKEGSTYIRKEKTKIMAIPGMKKKIYLLETISAKRQKTSGSCLAKNISLKMISQNSNGRYSMS